MGEVWRHKPRKKRSILWHIPKEQLEKIVAESLSFGDVLRHFGFVPNGQHHINMLKERLPAEGISYAHFIGRAKASHLKLIPLEDILVEGSTYHRGGLKQRLLDKGLLEYKCANPTCPMGDEWDGTWDGKPLVLVLDHINGVRDDNRLFNLRLLCSNCNSQTITFSGRHRKKHYHCADCGKEISRHSKRCKQCSAVQPRVDSRKVKNRPSEDMLWKQIKELGYCGTGRLYGVSDNAIRKWLGLR